MSLKYEGLVAHRLQTRGEGRKPSNQLWQGHDHHGKTPNHTRPPIARDGRRAARLAFCCRTTSASTAPRTPRRTCCPYAYVLITVPRVSRSCEHFPDGFDLHLLREGCIIPTFSTPSSPISPAFLPTSVPTAAETDQNPNESGHVNFCL